LPFINRKDKKRKVKKTKEKTKKPPKLKGIKIMLRKCKPLDNENEKELKNKATLYFNSLLDNHYYSIIKRPKLCHHKQSS
jgi:hypothetical protein